jgi:undecaprenyl-diphosphatase
MTLSELDTQFFFWINQGQRNPFFDLIMPYITEFNHWKFFILMAWFFLFVFGGKKLRIALSLTAILVGVLDYSNSFFFKHLFCRPRPCNVLPEVHTFWPCPRSFSFPSNHAANIFGAVFFLSHIYRIWSVILLPTAILVGYSRIYVGEHYPFDVLGGAILGALGAGIGIVLFNFLIAKWPEKGPGGKRNNE